MNAIVPHWTAIGLLSDIPVKGSRCIKLGSTTIGIFRTAEDEVYALEDKCPHKNGPLSQGIVHDNCVTCPLHNWVISLQSGQAQGADEGSVRTYRVRIVEEEVQIDIGSAE